MKAIRMLEAGKPLELQNIPIPPVGDRDILVRVRAAGVCHSDVHYRGGRSTMGRLPITLPGLFPAGHGLDRPALSPTAP